jgi:CubicO group peptidase (beta-lactamase class C family)
MPIQNIEKLDTIVEPMLLAARIPGAAIAIVADDRMVFAKGYGYRDLQAQLPVDSETVYPIASTTKAINATLIGMLVDEGKLAWDVPVQRYLPRFRLHDQRISAQVTLRDLLVMRTGLPRHDWLWQEHPITRADLVERLKFLELSCGFREKFQYCNLTATTAGHVAEIVTGEPWDALVRSRILMPLGMDRTGFASPDTGNVSLSYHENSLRQMRLSKRLEGDVTAPSGGSIHSTVADIARWMLFNLSGGKVEGRQLIQPDTLSEIQSPQAVARTDPSCPTPNAAYGMGWFIDTYNHHPRLTHGGYIHDFNSEVTLFPEDGIGIASFTNFGFPTFARLINQHVFDGVMGFKPLESVADKLARYERHVEATRQRTASVRRTADAPPSHPLNDYSGEYDHPGYGTVRIEPYGGGLMLKRGNLEIPLEHWHYEAWIAKDPQGFFINMSHPFDRSNRLLFDVDVEGEVAGLSIRFEPTVKAIRFEKRMVRGS